MQPRIFRALVESTCFGAKKINDCFESQNIKVKEVIAVGGVAKKSSFVMQTLADVLNMPIKVHGSAQTCAAGAAMFAAVAAGIYNDVQTAMQKMEAGFETVFHPDQQKALLYELRYHLYNRQGGLQESFFKESERI